MTAKVMARRAASGALISVMSVTGSRAPSTSSSVPLTEATCRRTVRTCIDQLPDTYRTILVLRDLEELTTDEAADALGISTNAVKVRLHRARQALLTVMSGLEVDRRGAVAC
jgi:DNA-directed RNA polymerase specialized sigma24 family protein